MQTKYSKTGDLNLENLDKAERFNNWMYEQIHPYLAGDILEIGSGTGTYSKKIIRDFPKSNILLSELDEEYAKSLQQKYTSSSTKVTILNIETSTDEVVPESIDTVFALNVFEHIKDDTKAMQNVYKLLKPGGKFIMLVPAHPFLYNCIDKSIDHYRRYTKKVVKEKVLFTNFSIEKMYFFNFFSIFGWYLNGNLLKKKTIDSNLLGIFDFFVPFFRFLEKYLFHGKIGISLIVIFSKPKE